MFVPPINEEKNNISTDAGNLLRTENDSTDFKNENLTTNVRRNKAKKHYFLLKKYSKTS